MFWIDHDIGYLSLAECPSVGDTDMQRYHLSTLGLLCCPKLESYSHTLSF